MNILSLAPTTLPDAPPIEYIEAAAATGYSHIGLRLVRSPGLPFSPVLGDAPLIREMRQRLASSGVSVVDILSFYLQPSTVVAAFEAALELSAGFGARYILVMGADEDRSRVIDNFGRLCDLAASYNLTCALEAAVMRPLATLPQMIDLIGQARRGNAVICIDPLNFTRAGDVAADIRALDPKMFPFAQICDGYMGPGEPDRSRAGRMGPNQRSLIGEGQVPLADILDALPAGLPLSVETPNTTEVSYSAAEWAKISLDNAREFMMHYRARSAVA